MNKLSPRKAVEAFTLVELLVVIAVVFILVLILSPVLYDRSPRPLALRCMSNLKQVGVGLIIFADDHNGRFPPQLSITNGGSLELIASNSPALHFRPLSNYLARIPSVWRCPADQSKQPLTTNSVLTDRNLSYFISVDATLALTNLIHAGDRNLQLAGQPVKPGLFTLTTNTAVSWTSEMHGKGSGNRWGNLLFLDGHVQLVRTNLPAVVQHQGLATNRLAVP